MAKGQVKKQVQPEDMVFALDIGTRSIIGMVGSVEEDKVKIIAIEKEDHTERAMIDGQIENIDKVAMLAKRVKRRLESRLKVKLNQVCVAAAGRALRTKRADFEMELPRSQVIEDETISRLEAGAISRAEKAFDADNEAENDSRNFYLVGYTVCQYYLDQYMMSSLKDHRGRNIKVDLIATFLPSEVIESLYTTMRKIGLEIASITLEPIAAINAAIPENLRLLNLVMVDIGAGTSDIAACTGGSVTGYTMATVAGDEITETIMKEYLVDFGAAEQIKAELETKEEVLYTDILGLEHKASKEDILKHIEGASEHLCKEISEKVLEVNGGAPSALFLAGGGSKLAGLKEGLTAALKMDKNRVAVAGNNFRANAYSDEYDLNNPEYATPLGIVISSGLNLINDSFRVTLNGKSAKLFRSGSFTVLNLLMMNGYSFQDILGRPGRDLVVTLNGKRKVFYGVPSQPASLFVNKREGKLSEVINAGDSIDFTPAVHGIPARAFLGDIEGALECEEITLNGEHCSLETLLKSGDKIVMRLSQAQIAEMEAAAEEVKKEDTVEEKKENIVEEEKNKAAAEKEEQADAESIEETRDTMKWKQEELDFGSLKGEQKDLAIEAGSRAEEEPDTRDGVRAEEGSDTKDEIREEENAQPSEENEPVGEHEDSRAETAVSEGEIVFQLNGAPLRLPQKEDGRPYYLMDMIQYSGIDLKNPKGRIELTVNGVSGFFQQELKAGDNICIQEE
ncbi:MAG: cell division protein FtsA [Dorea sp.]|nr:cell division protein FtsA [Dorea sp.]